MFHLKKQCIHLYVRYVFCLHVCMYVHCVHACYIQRLEEGIRFPISGVMTVLSHRMGAGH